MQKTFAFKPIVSALDEDGTISRWTVAVIGRLGNMWEDGGACCHRDQDNHLAFSITIYDDKGANPEAETALALFCPEIDRLGIAWGADATWADVESVETGIEMWLNDPTEWEARN